MGPRAVIVDGVRTPFCRAGGAFGHLDADDLGALAVRELLARTPVEPERIDEVIFGNVAQPAHAANVARVIALKAGLPDHIIAHTVHRNCASGMQAITAAAAEILAGRAQVIVAGGTESMSRIPLLFGPAMTRLFLSLSRARTWRARLAAVASFRPAHLRPVVALQQGLTDPVCELNMGQTAELLAREFGITRDEQDAFALRSHQKAVEAQRQGRFDDELIPLVPPPAYASAVTRDDGPRQDQTLEALRRLRPYFDREAGTVTAGNACQITDGAVAVLVCSDRAAQRLGLEPIGVLRAWAYAALDGAHMGLGPAHATARLLDRTGLDLDGFDLIELNEAFAAQVLANQRAFESAAFARAALGRRSPLGRIDPERLNVNGGAIALGHPVGASGTRLVLTALKELRRRRARRALATLCVGGGQGAALALEAA